MIKYKDLLFMIKDENDVMIKGRYDFRDKQVYFKSLDEEDIYYTLDDIEHIQDNFLNLYEEDEDLLKILMLHIRADKNLIEKIERADKDKLLFLYEA